MATITMTNFEARFLDQLTEDIKEIKSTVNNQGQLLNKIHRQTIRTNGRVTELEKDVSAVKEAPTTKKDLPNPWKDTLVIRIVVMTFFVIVLGLTGIRVAGLTL